MHISNATLCLIAVGVAFVPAALVQASDPVPGAVKDMAPFPGLSAAVTSAAAANNIAGHDADAIHVSVRENGSIAYVYFDFEKRREPDRLIRCDRSNDSWSCSEQSMRGRS